MCWALDSLLMTIIIDPVVVNPVAQSSEVPSPECLAEGGARLQVRAALSLMASEFHLQLLLSSSVQLS